MSTYRLGPKGASDLEEILDYTVDTWGEQQAENYIEELEESFQMLADSPGLGRPCDRIAPKIRRFEHREHVVFYIPERHGIIVARILHRRSLPHRLQFVDS